MKTMKTNITNSSMLVLAGAILLGATSASTAQIIPLEFEGGSNNTEIVDAWRGRAGSGWQTGWEIRTNNVSTSYTVDEVDPLHAGRGKYLKILATASTNGGTAYAYRQLDSNAGIDLSSLYSISFSIRLESALPSGANIAFFGSTVSGGAAGANNTWFVSANTNGWTAGINAGDADYQLIGGTLLTGTTYDVSVIVNAVNKTFAVSINDGSNVITSRDVGFRNQSAVGGGEYLSFGIKDIVNGGNAALAIDSITVIPETKTTALAAGAITALLVIGMRLRRR